MNRKNVHIVGTGTIGEPLIGLLCDYRNKLGIDDITFHKNTPLLSDKSKVIDLMRRGARLAVDNDKLISFREMGMEPELETEEAIKRSAVVIDCTPKGIGHMNKVKYYSKFKESVSGFIAQGSENGFGKKYAYGINDNALNESDQFVQVVSCNTHNLSCITKTLALEEAPDNLLEGSFVCVRRATDISQPGGFIPSPQVGKHSSNNFGSHHAEDAVSLFKTLNLNLNLFSSAMKVPSQYMHVVWFQLRVKNPVTFDDVIQKLENNPLVALTEKDMTSTVFSFGRDHGHYGRILNQTVVVVQSLNVRNNSEITGFCFTPQDGNSLLSSIAATEWYMYPRSYVDKIQCLSEYYYDWI